VLDEFSTPARCFVLVFPTAEPRQVGIFGSPEEQQRQWENACCGIVPDNPSLGMQIPSVHDTGMAPPGMHAASAYAFPVETPRDQHGHLKNEMADRVVDKITKYAPNFKDIQIRHITFAPYHMNTIFGALQATSATGCCTRT
jgi:phytoene dehydrogenase-like protein